MIEFNDLGGGRFGYRRMRIFSGAGLMTKAVILATALLGSVAADAKIIYVNIQSAAGGNGTSWARSFKYLQDGLAASAPGDSVYLAKGTYFPDDGKGRYFGDREEFFEVDGLKIYGGFAGNETSLSQRKPKVNVTVLSGEIWSEDISEDYARYWSLHVMVVAGSSTLDGVTVEKGRANGDEVPNNRGGGCLVDEGSTLTLVNCNVADNLACESGGAIWGDVVAKGCNFTNNVVDNEFLLSKNKQDHLWLFSPNCYGGAITGDVTASDCSFSNNSVDVVSLDLSNTSSASGGAIYGAVTAKNCTFDGNFAVASSYTLWDRLSGSDASSRGGAISGPANVKNCTFTNNSSRAVSRADFSPDLNKRVPYTAFPKSYGGAIAGKINSVNCTYLANSSSTWVPSGDRSEMDTFGGALYVEGASSIMNCVFNQNRVRSERGADDPISFTAGGGVYAEAGSTLPLANSTFLDNGTNGYGYGAALACQGNVNILSNIFWNTSETLPWSTPALDGFYTQNNFIRVGGKGRISNRLYPTPSTETKNILKGQYTTAVSSGPGANLDFGTTALTMLNLDPAFVDVASPAGDDGLWRTSDDGLRLTEESPAIGNGHLLFIPKDILDADSDGNVTELIPVDAAGFLRVQNKTLDLGAYEFGDTPPIAEISIEYPAATVLVDGVSTIDFGTILGAPTTKTFVIKNLGMGALNQLVITESGANAENFSFTQPVSSTVAPGGSTTFTVTMTPTVLGLRSAKIHIASNDPDESPFDINLQGQSLFPEIGVEQPLNTDLVDGDSVINYGPVGVTTSTTKTYTIRNTGKAPLRIARIYSTGTNASEFKVSSLASKVVAIGDSTTFDVSFAPLDNSLRSASIIIDSNDSGAEAAFLIKVTGRGTVSPDIAVFQPSDTGLRDGGAKSFGSVKAGLQYTKSFTIKNFGTGRLKNIELKVSGSNAFKVEAPEVSFIDPGSKTTFKVTFAPQSTGLKEAHLKITSNDGDESPFDITLTGTGVSGSGARTSSALVAKSALSDSHSSSVQSGAALSYAYDSNGSKYLVLTVQKSAALGAVTPTVEVSSNLMDWYSGAKHTTTTVDSATILKVRDNTPVTAGEPRYIRVKGN
jgi:hypothetical protein